MYLDLNLEKKMTSVFCRCCRCLKEIEKGKVRWHLEADGFRSSKNLFYHPHCFLDEIEALSLDFAKANKIRLSKKRKFFKGFHLAMALYGE